MAAAPLTQRAIAALAADAIAVGPDGRLPTNLEYQQSLHVGAGTVQHALRVLEGSGALAIASRGHQGRFVTRLEVGALWSLARLAPVRFAFPPPGAVEVYGLMEGISEHFARMRVPFSGTHRRGGRGRLALIAADDADATVMSCEAADGLAGDAGEALGSRDLGPDTYYAPDAIVVLGRPGSRDRPGGLRVGIDHASFDHVHLTYAEFPPGHDHTYVECDFPSMPIAVLEGRVDVGIWHRALLLIPPQLAGLEIEPLREPAAIDARLELSHAVVLFSTRRPEVAAACRALDGASVRGFQERLLTMDHRDPELVERYWLR